MTRVNKDDWVPQGVSSLENRAWDALRENESSVLVTAGAGAGKTEFLAQKATYLLQTGICPASKRILAISFKKDAAQNLAERVAKRCPRDQARRFDSMTFDAFTKGLLDRFHPSIPEPFNALGAYQIVNPSHKDYGDFLERYGYQGVSAQQLEGRLPLTNLPIDLLNGSEIHRALADYWHEQFFRREEISLSFPMINRLVKLLLQENSYISRALQATYPIVFLDEYQDTTYAQYDMLLTAFDGSDTVFTAVGDDKQRIMGWAGAMDDAFAQFEKDFGAKRISLLSNWRSHEDLVRIQHEIARQIDGDVEEVQAQGVREIEGEVSTIWQFRSTHDENNYLAEWVNREVLSGRVEPHDVAILIRMRADQVEQEIAPAFAARGLRIRNAARSVGEIQIQDLLGEELTGIFIPLLRLGSTDRSPGNWALAQQNYLFLEAADPDNDLTQELLQVKLETFVRQLRTELTHRQPDSDSAKVISEMILEFVGSQTLRQSFPAYQRKRDFDRVWNGFVALMKECAEHSSSWTKALDEFEGVDQVALMTVHKSKGLEFHTMIFYGLDNQTWWSLTPQRSEELNTFFVAFTRAKQRAFFSQCVERGRAISWIQQLLAPVGVETIDGTTILDAT
ncbi:ATP-dependent helicase [Providencia stuartii]|uniref:DNA 3'-5' helicase n=2 Tax=Enterobacterales TaxID=91347 RepID=A0A9N8CY33_PRORE|nr:MULTISPECIES: ATP-dependent helicase [Morganellaceae]ELR5268608.1 ATP-dependent helicase [Providencia rettgeri]MBG2906512.1 ATP-dependent helicase [Proteus mirabilis]MBG3022013.1 ATP-dependent helicase [Proteus mirabilis]MBN5555840.1 ATP-dependent helicase [Providencia stuartii]MBN7840382.1 ATP-dependent helicase [Providencia rettgeri]